MTSLSRKPRFPLTSVLLLLIAAGGSARAQGLPGPAAPDERAAADAAAAAGEGPAASTQVLGFAEQLYGDGDYYRAITEYKRFLFLHQTSDLADWVRLRIGQAYLAGGRQSAAQAVFFDLSTGAAKGRLKAWASLALARSYYLDGRLMQAADLLQSLDARPGDPAIVGSARYLAACIQIKVGALERAEQSLAAIPAADSLAARAAVLLARLPAGRDLPHKSPVAAGLLSLVPGLGHFYLEDYSVGLTAMAWNALFGYATYEAFHHRRWGLGALLATMELLWYSGTVYGAVAGAERYNRDAQLNYLDELDRQAKLDVDFPGQGWMAELLVGGRF